jgi:hypothetical protein
MYTTTTIVKFRPIPTTVNYNDARLCNTTSRCLHRYVGRNIGSPPRLNLKYFCQYTPVYHSVEIVQAAVLRLAPDMCT